MAIRNIIKQGDPVLREISNKVTAFDMRLCMLLDDMKETLEYADGVGLAAVQVGVLKRVCIVAPPGKKVYELINPQIVGREGTQSFDEGCLSIPGKHGVVTRPQSIVVKAQDRQGTEFTIEADGFLAVVLCHEIDHLDGILYVDRMDK